MIAIFAQLTPQLFGGSRPAWLTMELGTEDLQDTYRGSLTDESSIPLTIITFFRMFVRAWRAAEMVGHSFGFQGNVTKLNPWPGLVIAVASRILWVITASFVDDVRIIDHNGGRAQRDAASTSSCGMRDITFSRETEDHGGAEDVLG